MNKKIKDKLYSLSARYIILILTAIPNLALFYLIFTPLTIYPSYFLLSLFFDVSLSGTTINFLGINSAVKIIGACIAGSAYYLLLILNLSIPNIKFLKRIKMLALSFLIFLVANILRIVLLSAIYISKPNLFDITHKLSWYFGSIIFVALIWFFEVRKFKIKEIPFYSDIKFLSKHIK